MKTCFVVLERLDENLINHYLQKCESKISPTLSFSKNTKVEHKEKPKKITENKKRSRKNVENSVVKKKVKRKRIKDKPLCYSDDEDHPDYTANDSFIPDDTESVIKNLSSSPCADSKESRTRSENAKLDLTKNKEIGSGLGTEQKQNSISKNIQGSCCNKSCECIRCYRKIVGEKNINILERIETENQSFFKTAFPAKENEELESESREDGEDDRITVIFEEQLRNDEDHNEIIERARTVRKKDIKIRKKQTLIKFRRKKLRSIRKPKNGFAEKSNSKEPVKRTISVDKVGEDCFKEVCCLVKRLHDLYQVISQLQRELPKNDDLAVHFSKVISAQQENFSREIRKSQKTILQGYEKMLVSYRDPDKVTLEISRKTSLNAEDVINVLSCCLLLEGASEGEKNDEVAEKIEVFQSEKTALNSENKFKSINENSSRRIWRTIQSSDIEPSHPFFPSRNVSHHPESDRRPINEPVVGGQLSTGGQNQVFKSFLGPYCSSPKQCEEKLCTRQYYSEKVQTAFDPRIAHVAHDWRQRNPHVVPRHLPQTRSTQSADITAQNSPTRLIPLNFRPDSCGHPVNCFNFCHQGSLFSTGEEATNLPLSKRSHPRLFPHHLEEKSSANHLFQRNLEIPNTSYSILLPGVDKTVECVSSGKNSALPYLPMCVFPPKTFDGVGLSQNQSSTAGTNQCPLEGILTDFIYSGQKFSRRIGLPKERIILNVDESAERNLCTEVNLTVHSENNSSETLQSVLDPTVPQKLTLKNYRLQAGPVLDSEANNKMSESISRLKPLIKEGSGLEKLENPITEDSKSRVYDCARNGCKNPGARICKGCQSIIYCSDTCQLKHWTQKHREECHQLKKLRG